jgi:DNA-binding winged helix-turn-helix (wHTH) protein
MKRVRPGAHVDESNLVVTISSLRKALGERVCGRHYIKTVSRRGYRFLARATESFNEPGVRSARFLPRRQ